VKTSSPETAEIDPRDALDVIARSQEAELVHVERLPARRPRTVELPDLAEPLPGRLELLGITELYTHQARALELARAREHFVVATGTASGKTICYQLPICETAIVDPLATTLYLAPTKALARDQLRALRAWRLPRLKAAALDGDTPGPERDAIRQTANVVLTNPDLLHHSLLPDHSRWGDFLHRLTYVVVDECHVARGVFGAHVGLVLRRLRRICSRYGAEPTFILASATIGNPTEHAAELAGIDVTAITEDGSGRGPLEVALWQPPLIDEVQGIRASAVGEAGRLMAALVSAGVQTLAFARSRRAAEVTAIVAREHLEGLAETIAAYRAGYLPEERRELERALVEGRILGLAATEALELGLDVGGLDAVVLVGWPGTAASFWQRLGRAGRSGEAALGVLIAGDDPLDQYLVGHPAELFARPAEDAIVDPGNPYVLGPHLRCATQEDPLDRETAEEWFGTGATALIEADAESGVLRERGGRFFWTGRGRAAADVSLRSTGGRPLRIVDTATGALVGDVDEARAYRQTHPGAIYLHQGQAYEITDLDRDRRLVAARPAPEASHTTRARVQTDVRVVDEREGRDLGEVTVTLGRVEVSEQVTGYDVLDQSRRVIDQRELDLPAVRLTTVAIWWAIAPKGVAQSGIGSARLAGALHAAEHAAIGLLPLIALCDRWDLGGLSTTLHPDTEKPTVFIYDGVAGGAGLAERSYARLREHLTATRGAIAGCRCASGCPSCIHSPKCGNGNEPLDKAGAVAVLDLVLTRM
jgi:DEAD/DEAH box helicase domain-containing protein